MMLKKEIWICFGIVFALIVLSGAWTAGNLLLLGKPPNTILKENYRSILATENMVDAIERQDSGILRLLLNDTQEGINQFRKNEAEFLKWLALAKDNITIKKEADLVRIIETQYANYRQNFSSLADFSETNSEDLAPFTKRYKNEIQPIFNEVRKTCLLLRDLNQASMSDTSKTNLSASKSAFTGLIVITAIILIGVLIFTLRIIRHLINPIENFQKAFKKVAAEDFTAKVFLKNKDEWALLADEFNQLVVHLEKTHQNNATQISVEKNKSKALLSSIEDGVIVFNTDLEVIDINPAAQRMLYLTITDEKTLKCSDILQGTAICKTLSEIAESGHPPDIADDQQRMITLSQNEHFYHYLFSITAIYENENNLSGIVLLLRDVTRLKEVERLKNEFVLAASHELRTPLTTLGMSIDSLQRKAATQLGKEEKELLQTAHEEVHRMKALVNDLLDLSNVNSGRIAIEFESVPVETIVKYVKKIFKGQMEGKSVTLKEEFSPDLPNIRADANKITWVLSNLISNAMRYVNDGGHIQLVANRIGPQIHMSVRDDGPGIPLEYQSKIFQKYVQVKGQESGGTGLGLAICKEIVRAHGGGIWVESLPGQGSTFTFTLPIAH